LRLLNRAVVRLASIRALDDALGVILDALLCVWPIDAGGIYVIDEETGGLRLASHRGLPEAFVRRVERFGPDSPNARLVQSGQPVYARYVDVLRAIGLPLEGREPLRGIGIIPILHEGRAIGALNAASYGVDEIPPEARSSLESLGAHIAGALSRLAAEREADNERQNLTTFFSATQDLLFVIDLSGALLHCNEAVERRLGYSADELRGQPLALLHPPEAAGEVAACVAGMAAARGGYCRLPLRARDGSLIQAETRVASGRWQNRDVLFGISRDMTDRNRLEALLRQSQKMEALGNLAGGVAHDFKNVLAAISLCAEAAAEAAEAGQSPAEDIRAILESVERGSDLVKRILAFARKSHPDLRPTDVHGELTSAVHILRRTLPRVIQIELELPDAPALVWVDPGGFSAALFNLAVNARDAMPDGGTLRLCASRGAWRGDEADGPGRPGDFLRVSVADTGQGMDEATQARVFEPFFTTKSPGEGVGLGLAMVYATVRDAAGEVRCSSVPGKGTTFDLFLPLASVARS